MTGTAKDVAQLASGGAVLAGRLSILQGQPMHRSHTLQLFFPVSEFFDYF
jgi:hypothetical protein